ncbi:MAG: prepilin-type N-terminal cleavage/methylation domain-containing protein [candidate division Zixibacteria bacterium]|nr:prepilin-type N-terminal cleavage/methylation domain-containing protein [candidate division Zixibacteria bacterium]
MKAGKMRNQRGLTLLEVLVAMIIMGISLLMLLNMTMVALDGNDWSNQTTIAAQSMQEKLEQLRSDPDLSPSSGGTDTSQGVATTWTVTNSGNHLRRVDVEAIWTDIRGHERTNTLTAYVKTDSL